MILLIDNYDSFSYNVYQLTASVEPDVKVVRNNEITVEEIEALSPSHIIISPGPGRPADAGICEQVIKVFQGRIPILGICLGHQAVCEVYGASIVYARELMHGKQSVAALNTDSTLFKGMYREMKVARYHSLAADPASMPDCLMVTAIAQDGEIMAVEHREYPVYGVQFHPESVLTSYGRKIMENFIKYAGKEKSKEAAGRWGENVKEHLNTEKESLRAGEKEGKEAGQQSAHIIEEAIIKLSKKEDIGYETAKAVMDEIMSGKATDVQKSAYLTALAMKGENIGEITGSAEMMRKHALSVNHGMQVMEIVGTGGDGSNSFNISTTASLVIAAAGVPVAKHGNRAASSRSGAADCLEALGVNISVEPQKAEELLKTVGICFLFAQKYHTAMKYVAPIRRELGIRTVFNILGPLTNPAKASMQIMGVYEEALLEPMAQVLMNLGVRKGMVVYGQEKLDEISVCGPTSICAFNNGHIKKYVITPEEMDLKRGKAGDLFGGTPQENAEITKAILSGRERGAKRDAVVMNAAAALLVAGKASGLKEAARLAEETIDSGRALAKLEEFIRVSKA